MRLAEDEAIARKKRRKREKEKRMKKSIPLCKPFREYFKGLDTQEELNRWRENGIVKYVLNSSNHGYLSNVVLFSDGSIQEMTNSKNVSDALVFETYHEGFLKEVRNKYPDTQYESLPDKMHEKKPTATDLDRLFDAIDKEADRRELNAAHAGERGDYGASKLREQVRFFRLGMKGEIPTEWEKYEKLLDPEYAEWQRLNKKFGGKS